MSIIGKNLERIIDEKWLGYGDVAKMCHISRATVRNIVENEAVPREETIIKLSIGLAVKREELCPGIAPKLERYADAQTIGERIRWIAEDKGITVRQISQKSQMCSQQIKNIISGKNKPRLSSLKRISEALEVPVRELIPGKWY